MTPASILSGALGMLALASALPATAQGMMQHVDMTSPEMTSAEMTRGEVETIIVEDGDATPR